MVRLIDDMRREADKLANRAAGYRMAGEGLTARLTERACLSLRHAISALEEAQAAENEASRAA